MKAKLFLAAALIACVCLGACSGQGAPSSAPLGEASRPGSESTSSGSESAGTPEQEAEDSNLLSQEEIVEIFSDLDSKSAEIVDKWVNKDYTQIPIDGVPTHQIENAIIGKKGVDSEEGSGFVPIYGTAVFAKVTEDTLPGFPWESTEEICNAITNICLDITTNYNLTELIVDDPKQMYGIFYQFDDGLYFRTSYIGNAKDYSWDYSSMEILKNTPNEVQVQMYDTHADQEAPYSLIGLRTLVKKENGNWVIADERHVGPVSHT